MKYILAALVVVFSVFGYFFCYHQDADFTLLFYEKFGREPCSVLGGKVVWITGASSGIGEYLAYELAQCGCKLVLSARRKHELDRVRDKCAEIAIQHHKSYDKNKDILVLPMDLKEFSSHRNLNQQVLSHFKQIDVLVNNAGRAQRGWMKNTPVEVEQDLLDLNLVGAMSLTKAVLPHMLERRAGQIVVVNSIMGKFGFPYLTTYAASKFGLQGYFKSLRLELADTDINVQIVCPGHVKSNIAANSITEEKDKAFKDTDGYTDPGERMPTERCTKLMAVGMAHNMSEIWISIQPALTLTYMSQYMPTVFDWYSKDRFLNIMKARFIKG